MTTPSPLRAVSAERLAAALRDVRLPDGRKVLSVSTAAYLARAVTESGAVVPVASLADDEALVERVTVELCGNGDEYSAARHLMVEPVLRALAAALED